LTGDPRVAPSELTLTIEPTPENGCKTRSYALSCYLATTSVRRIQATPSRILPEQLTEIRRQIAVSVGLE
jgi:hypothetical protein